MEINPNHLYVYLFVNRIITGRDWDAFNDILTFCDTRFDENTSIHKLLSAKKEKKNLLNSMLYQMDRNICIVKVNGLSFTGSGMFLSDSFKQLEENGNLDETFPLADFFSNIIESVQQQYTQQFNKMILNLYVHWGGSRGHATYSANLENYLKNYFSELKETDMPPFELSVRRFSSYSLGGEYAEEENLVRSSLLFTKSLQEFKEALNLKDKIDLAKENFEKIEIEMFNDFTSSEPSLKIDAELDKKWEDLFKNNEEIPFLFSQSVKSIDRDE